MSQETLTLNLNKKGSFEHFVQFYKTEDYLNSLLSNYFRQGIMMQDVCIAIATPEHLKGLREQLERNIDIDRAIQTKRLILLDAAETLSQFMVNGSPDPKMFNRVVGSVIDIAKLRGRHVRAFGEMVVLLWQQGNLKGAIKLEKLWNNLGKTRNFSLLCSYPLRDFDGETSVLSINHVCNEHCKVFREETRENVRV